MRNVEVHCYIFVLAHNILWSALFPSISPFPLLPPAGLFPLLH